MQLNRTFDSVIQNLRIESSEKVLIACSGGLDSMCLLNLCLNKGLNVEVAHVNYGLRGEDSKADEDLVRSFCKRHSIPIHISKWTPKASESGSLQMQCRNHRYQFFDDLMDKHGMPITFLAHHANDNVETVLLNLFKGTGINGLSGIPEQRDRFFRPLLAVFRAEIENYVNEFEVPYNDDVSNFESKYDRNFIRNEVLPLIEKRFTGSAENMVRSIGNLRQTNEFLNHEIGKLKSIYWTANGDGFTCELSKLKQLPGHQHLLFTWLSPFGFNTEHINGILQQKTGAEFRSHNYRIVVSRDKFMGEKIETNQKRQILFNLNDPPNGWTVESYPKTEDWNADPTKNTGEFDFDRLEQLQIRNWKEGDKFRPLGMNGWKKLSDFFIDEKLSILEKEKVKMLVSRNDIVWVIGMRLDDRFKVNKDTKTVLRLTYDPNN